MTKKDFFVITESDNLYLDLAPCRGYIVFDTIEPDKPIAKETFLCSGDYEWEALEDARAILAQRESEKKRE